MPFKINFLTCYSSDHDISMANADIDALHAGSLRITVAYVFPRKFTFYKWCVTKVAHCINLSIFECLFVCLILYVPSTIFQLYRDGSSWVEPVLS